MEKEENKYFKNSQRFISPQLPGLGQTKMELPVEMFAGTNWYFVND